MSSSHAWPPSLDRNLRFRNCQLTNATIICLSKVLNLFTFGIRCPHVSERRTSGAAD